MLSGLSPNAIRDGLLLYLLGMASAVVAVLTVQWVGKRQPIAQHSAASPVAFLLLVQKKFL